MCFQNVTQTTQHLMKNNTKQLPKYQRFRNKLHMINEYELNTIKYKIFSQLKTVGTNCEVSPEVIASWHQKKKVCSVLLL